MTTLDDLLSSAREPERRRRSPWPLAATTGTLIIVVSIAVTAIVASL